MRKSIALFTIIACLLLQFALVTNVSANAVFTPVILDFEDYQDESHPEETVEEYLTRKGWSENNMDHAEIVTVNGNKRIKYSDSSALNYSWTDSATNYSAAKYPNSKMVIEQTFKFDIEEGTTSNLSGAYFPGLFGNADSSSATATNNRIVNSSITYGTSGYDYTNRGSGLGWSEDFNDAVFNGDDITITTIAYYNESATNGGTVQKIWNDDYQKLNAYFNKPNNTEVKYLTFNTAGVCPVYFDDLRVYLVSTTFAADTPEYDGQSDVSVDTDITLSFNNPVLADTLEKITVTADGEPVDAKKYSVNPVKDSNGLNTKAEVVFEEGIANDTTYVITIPTTVKDTARQTLAEEKIITFTTEELPAFEVEMKAYKGLKAAGTELSALSGAANSTISCVVTATNSDDQAQNPNIIAALYDSNGELIKFVSAKRAFTAGGVNSFAFSMSVPGDTEGLTLKAFVCADLFDWSAFGEAAELAWE